MEVREASVSYEVLSNVPTEGVPFGYKKTEVGVIPADWMICKLGSFCEIVAGGDLVKEDFSMEMDQRHPFPVFSNALSRSGLYGYSTSSRFGPDCITVTARGDVGHAFYRNQEFCAIGRVLVVSARQRQNCELRFVAECINNLVKFALESTGVPQLTAPQIARYEVPLPPTLVEQEAIAEALSDADALIESLEQLIAKKRQIKQGTMQALLTGKQRLPGFGGDWATKNIRQLTQIPVTDGPHLTPVFLEGGVPFLSVNNLVNNKIDFSDVRYISKEDDLDFSRKCKPRKNDILLGKAASVGKVAIVDVEMDFNIWSPIALIRPDESVCPRFLYYAFQSRSVLRQIELMTNSSSQGNIGMGDIERLAFTLPKRAEQEAIAEFFRCMDIEISELETRLAKTRQLKQGMMQELLTGRIRLV